MGAPRWPPFPQMFGAHGGAVRSSNPTWRSKSPAFGASRPRRDAPLPPLAAEELADQVTSAEDGDEHRQRMIAQRGPYRLRPSREPPSGHLHQLFVGTARELASAVPHAGDRPLHLLLHREAPRPAQAIGRARRARLPSSSAVSD